MNGFWLGVAAAAFVVGLSGYGLHSISVNMLEAKHSKELKATELALTDKCEADKAITSKVSSEYQSKLSDLSRKLAAAHKLHERSSCVSIFSFSPARYDAAGKSGKPSGSRDQGAASSEAVGYAEAGSIIDLMGEGEKYRLQLSSCQEFVSAVQGQSRHERKKR